MPNNILLPQLSIPSKKVDSLSEIFQRRIYELSTSDWAKRIVNSRLQLYSLFAMGASYLPDQILESVIKQHILRGECPESQNTKDGSIQHLGPTGQWRHNRSQNSLGRDIERFSHLLTLANPFDSHEKRNLVPTLRTIQVPIDSLPMELEGISIIQLTDLHMNQLSSFATPDLMYPVIDEINKIAKKERVFVVFTGDLFTDQTDGENVKLIAKTRALLQKIKAEKYAILGNHDYIVGKEKVRKILQSSGFKVLENEASRVIEIGRKKLQFTGVGSFLFWDNNTTQTFSSLSETNPDTLIHLIHEPNSMHGLMQLQSERREKVVLTLAGHTHGNKKPHEERIALMLERIIEDVYKGGIPEHSFQRDSELSTIYGTSPNVPFSKGFYRWNNGGKESMFHISPGSGSVYVANQRVDKAVVTQMILRTA